MTTLSNEERALATDMMHEHFELASELEGVIIRSGVPTANALISLAILTVIGLRQLIADGMDEKIARDEYTKLLTGVYVHLSRNEDITNAH